MAIPWQPTGLAHKIRAFFSPADYTCAFCGKRLDPTNMLVDTRGYTFCDEGCADDDSHAAEQRRYAEAASRLADDQWGA